jgi:hypothetical protein
VRVPAGQRAEPAQRRERVGDGRRAGEHVLGHAVRAGWQRARDREPDVVVAGERGDAIAERDQRRERQLDRRLVVELGAERVDGGRDVEAARARVTDEQASDVGPVSRQGGRQLRSTTRAGRASFDGEPADDRGVLGRGPVDRRLAGLVAVVRIRAVREHSTFVLRVGVGAVLEEECAAIISGV